MINTAAFDKALRALGLDPEASWADVIVPFSNPVHTRRGTMWDAAQKDRGRKVKAGMEDLPHFNALLNSGAYKKVLNGEIKNRKDVQ